MKEYLISYEARSETIDKRHAKVIFLNKERDVIDVQYIYEVDEQFKDSWNSYEQIFSAPEGASFMQLQVWCRGDKKDEGVFQMKNYSILPYDQLILLDNISLRENRGYLKKIKSINNLSKEKSDFFTPVDTGVQVSYERTDTMKREFQVVNPDRKRVLISYGESPNPLWKESIGNQRVDRVINGVGAFFINEESGSGEVAILLRKVYYLGVVLLVFSFFIYGGYRIFSYRRNKKKSLRKGGEDGSGNSHNNKKS